MRVAVLLLLSTFASSHTTAYVPPEEARQHLLSTTPPKYPPIAALARLEGVVFLQIEVNVSGAVSNVKVISGHPMLTQAAIDAVIDWKYRPFNVDGAPGKIQTFVRVIFGSTKKEEEARAELSFLYDYWSTMDAGQAALDRGDYAASEEAFRQVSALLAKSSKDARLYDRSRLLQRMGHLDFARSENQKAEQAYKAALDLLPSSDKSTPQYAEILSDLGEVYWRSQSWESAAESLSRANKIYQRHFKDLEGNPEWEKVRARYGTALAHNSALLADIASQQKNAKALHKECRLAAQLRQFGTTVDESLLDRACSQVAGK